MRLVAILGEDRVSDECAQDLRRQCLCGAGVGLALALGASLWVFVALYLWQGHYLSKIRHLTAQAQ